MADLSDLDLRVLSHYAAGTPLSVVAGLVGMDAEDVRDLVGMHTGYDRKKARELVERQARWRPASASAAPRVAEPAPVPVQRSVELPAKPAAPRAPRKPSRTAVAAYAGPGDVLHSYPSYACLGCGSRRFEAFDCCCAKALPVTVTVSRREVPSA